MNLGPSFLYASIPSYSSISQIWERFRCFAPVQLSEAPGDGAFASFSKVHYLLPFSFGRSTKRWRYLDPSLSYSIIPPLRINSQIWAKLRPSFLAICKRATLISLETLNPIRSSLAVISCQNSKTFIHRSQTVFPLDTVSRMVHNVHHWYTKLNIL